MRKVVLPVKVEFDFGPDSWYDANKREADAKDVESLANLSGELAELVRDHEGASVDPLCWGRWKEKARGILARFDAIAEVKR